MQIAKKFLTKVYLLVSVVLFIFVFIPLLVYADESSYSTSSTKSIVFSGSGKKTSEPIDVVEGTLTFRIKTTTSCSACGFFLNIQQDNNLDGTFCGGEDGYCGGVFSAGYENIKNLDTVVNFSSFYYGGRIKLATGNIGTFPWEVEMEQHPQPRHSIAGRVKDSRFIAGFVEGADIMATDTKGNTFRAKTNELGEYKMNVFGFTNYTVKAIAPGYLGQTRKVAVNDFLSLGYPSWDVKVNFELQVGEDENKSSNELTEKPEDEGNISKISHQQAESDNFPIQAVLILFLALVIIALIVIAIIWKKKGIERM